MQKSYIIHNQRKSIETDAQIIAGFKICKKQFIGIGCQWLSPVINPNYVEG
jgi:hypothetical protein